MPCLLLSRQGNSDPPYAFEETRPIASLVRGVEV